MPKDDLLNRDNFGLLEDPKKRFGSFTVSAITNLVLAGLAILFMIAQLHRVPDKPYQQTQLVFPIEQPQVSPPPVPKVKIIPPPPPQPQVAKITPPKVETPEPPKIQPIQPIVTKAPELPKVPAPAPKVVTPPPQPKVGMFASNTPTPVANNKVTPTVAKSAGFGDPMGAVPNPNSTKTTIAAVGSFSGAPGVGTPSAGAARKGSVQGVNFGSGVANGVPGGSSRGTVASAGFANGVTGGQPGGSTTGKIQSGGFGGGGIGNATTTQAQKQQVAPTSTPPELTYSVKPQYTAEARAAKLEGKVILHVKILPNGRVEVLGVVRGLGEGLDEQARRAAEQFRFKPATQNGVPVDFTTDIQITFQLA
jgi:TonB family protein